MDYLEWDGLLRICFIRKNKTLQASFKNKTVLDLLGENKDKFSENSKNEKDLIEQLGKIGIDDDGHK